MGVINKWRYTSGFMRPMRFLKSFRGSFFGAKLGIGTYFHPLDMYIDGKDEKGIIRMDGRFFRFYQAIADTLNFSIQIVNHSGRDMYNFPLYVQDVKDRKTDIVGGWWACRHQRYQIAGDVSATYDHVDGNHIISIEPLKGSDPWSAYLKPIDQYTWAGIFCTILLTALILHVLCKAFKPRERARFSDSLWHIISITCWDTPRWRHPSLPMILLLSCYMLAYFIIISNYFGEYAAHVVVPKYRTPPIDDLEQLWASNYKWVSSDAAGETAVWYSFFGHVPNLKEKHVDYTVLQNDHYAVKALSLVAEHPDDLVYFQNADMEYYINKYSLTPPGRKFYFSKTRFRSSAACSYHTKRFYAKEETNRKIMAMRDYGIWHHIERNYLLPSTVSAGVREGTPLNQRITLDLVKLEHILVSIVVIGIAYAVAIVALVYEIIDNMMETNKKRKASEAVTANKDQADKKGTSVAWVEDEGKSKAEDGVGKKEARRNQNIKCKHNIKIQVIKFTE